MSETSRTALKAAIVATLMAGLIATAAEAAPKNNGQPADTMHPDIHDKVGQGDGTNANPNGNGAGGQIHGIANVPGQDDNVSPSDGDHPGFKDQLDTVHGGWSDWQADKQDALP